MKKINFRKLKFNMWFYFIVFIVIIVAVIWLFQMFFLEGDYQRTKVANMKEYGSMLVARGDRKADFEFKVRECRETGITVYVTDQSGSFLYPDSAADSGEKISDKPESQTGVVPVFDKVIVGYAIEKKIGQGIDEICDTYNFTDENGLERVSVYYYITDIAYGETKGFLVMTSSHAKLNESVKVLTYQYVIIALLVAVLGVFFAWYMSARLSKPLDKMAETAKRWAEGENSVAFEADGGYAEINELADALNYAKEGISRSGALQRDLLANVSHDLKTPLTMIKAYAEMIKDISGDNKEKREKHTQVIIDEADRLAMLVNDILNLSKLQSSVENLDMKEINLSELTERVIGRFSDYVEKQGYKIEDRVAPDLITVADEKKVEQVIYNLLGNSINYTGEDKTVKIFLTAENDKILLEIIDSGKGISAEKLDTIWERYYRFSETNTRPVKGTGLGLSIVKAILDSHKLKYGVRSKKDFGSNFFVEFNRVKNE